MRNRALTTVLLVALFAPPLLAAPVTISKETTFITEPVTEDGWPDYIGGLNRLLSEGVTQENNAAAALWEALGPARVEAASREEFFRRLGIPMPAEDGDYLVMPADLEIESDDIETLEAELEEARKRVWTVKEFPPLANWLEKNRGPLDCIVEGLGRPRWFEPLVQEGIPPVFFSSKPGIPVRSDLRMVLRARAMLHIGTSAPEAALRDLLALHRLARLSARGSVIDHLVGITLEAAAYESDVILAASGKAPPELQRRYALELKNLPEMPHPAAVIGVEERCAMLDAICAIAVDPGAVAESTSLGVPLRVPLGWRSMNWDAVLRMANRWADGNVAALSLTSRADRMEAFERIGKERNRRRRMRKNPGFVLGVLLNRGAVAKLIGWSILDMMDGVTQKLAEETEKAQLRTEMIQVVFALTIHREEKGSFPAKLEEVLDTVSTDTFTGEPILYERTEDGFVLRSVGPDGETAPDVEDGEWGDDIVFRVPARSPDAK